MSRPADLDELFVHQVPAPVGAPDTYSHHWRESYFFDIHDPDGTGDVVFFTMARYPAQGRMDSLQMGRIGGMQQLAVRNRPFGDGSGNGSGDGTDGAGDPADGDGDPYRLEVPGARVEVVEPFRTLKLWAEGDAASIGLDLTFEARTEPYLLRRGTMRAGAEVVWDQSHILQSGRYTGRYWLGDDVHEVDGWIGQRDHSWGIRDHGRCPLWTWFQIQLDDGFLGMWHWEYENGARVYTDGCWAPTDGSAPTPVIDFSHDLRWIAASGDDGGHAEYGTHGQDIAGLAGTCRFVLEGGRAITVEAEGTFARPYEPFHRGGLNLMKVRTDDGREGTAIYEVTGARHHHFFPHTDVPGALPR